jgi:murein DD-endopeptidase MepM/ murein hydrolase activator NlpD
MRRNLIPIVLLTGAVLLAGCSSSSDSGASASATGPDAGASATDGVVAGYATDVDETSPLVIRPAGPAPIPVTGTDGKVHMAYELEVLNFSPRPAALTKVETLSGGPDGEVVASVEGQDLIDRTILVMDTTLQPIEEIPVGRTALVLVDDTYDTKADVPATFSHRLTASFGAVPPEYAGYASLFPDGSVTQFGAPVSTGTGSPIVIGPPLAGDDWMAQNACCSLSPHRGAILPVGGRINPSERYAIDWWRVDQSADADLLPGRTVSTHSGDPTDNESYLAHGEPLLAVADGTVVTVVSDLPDEVPQVVPVGLQVAELGGNVVVIDIGGGIFAFYAHLVPGSPTVKVGDKVTRGQVIGMLGNSGNTSEAHLHFQLATSAASLTGDNVPFEIDTLTLVGNYPDGGVFGPYTPGPNAGARTNQLPLIGSLVSFPSAPEPS